jgi:hypothetical protein
MLNVVGTYFPHEQQQTDDHIQEVSSHNVYKFYSPVQKNRHYSVIYFV